MSDWSLLYVDHTIYVQLLPNSFQNHTAQLYAVLKFESIDGKFLWNMDEMPMQPPEAAFICPSITSLSVFTIITPLRWGIMTDIWIIVVVVAVKTLRMEWA